MKSAFGVGLIVALAILFLLQCKKASIPIPACILVTIDSIKKAPQRIPPAEVHLWIYNNRNVYLFNAPCCDQFVKLLDENCNYVCSPSGGPAKTGDSLCTDFYQQARYIQSVWKDDR